MLVETALSLAAVSSCLAPFVAAVVRGVRKIGPLR